MVVSWAKKHKRNNLVWSQTRFNHSTGGVAFHLYKLTADLVGVNAGVYHGVLSHIGSKSTWGFSSLVYLVCYLQGMVREGTVAWSTMDLLKLWLNAEQCFWNILRYPASRVSSIFLDQSERGRDSASAFNIFWHAALPRKWTSQSSFELAKLVLPYCAWSIVQIAGWFRAHDTLFVLSRGFLLIVTRKYCQCL